MAAQASVYGQVVRELQGGRKVGHWMWYVFPQFAGLGKSDISRLYALHSLEEAEAYESHPLLGARLHACTALVLGHSQLPLTEIFGSTDALKFHSSVTLFAQATTDNEIFLRAIECFCGGQLDATTVRLLRQVSNG